MPSRAAVSVFLSDAHLTGLDDPNQEKMVSFLRTLPPSVGRLFILGDLFDFWWGFSHAVYYHYVPVLDAILSLSRRGVRITYLEGNHDLHMGSFFRDAIRADVHTTPVEETIQGKRFFLAHGDQIDKTDRGYRLLRGILRFTPFVLLAKAIPPGLLWEAGQRFSAMSRKAELKEAEGRKKEMEKLSLDFAEKKVKEGYDVIVMGHTHTPQITEVEAGGKKGKLVNLGDWRTHLTYLVVKDGDLSFSRFSPEEG